MQQFQPLDISQWLVDHPWVFVVALIVLTLLFTVGCFGTRHRELYYHNSDTLDEIPEDELRDNR